MLSEGASCNVWTATEKDGSLGNAGGDCNAWVGSAAFSPGLVRGAAGYQNIAWTEGCIGGSCAMTARLYCFEQ